MSMDNLIRDVIIAYGHYKGSEIGAINCDTPLKSNAIDGRPECHRTMQHVCEGTLWYLGLRGTEMMKLGREIGERLEGRPELTAKSLAEILATKPLFIKLYQLRGLASAQKKIFSDPNLQIEAHFLIERNARMPRPAPQLG